MFIRPFFLLGLMLVLGYCVRRPIEKHMKDGRLKRLLLRRIR